MNSKIIIAVVIVIIILLLWWYYNRKNASTTTNCPTNSSTVKTLAGTNVANCYCTTGFGWNGLTCVSCPANSSNTTSGSSTNITGCYCSTNLVWSPSTNSCTSNVFEVVVNNNIYMNSPIFNMMSVTSSYVQNSIQPGTPTGPNTGMTIPSTIFINQATSSNIMFNGSIYGCTISSVSGGVNNGSCTIVPAYGTEGMTGSSQITTIPINYFNGNGNSLSYPFSDNNTPSSTGINYYNVSNVNGLTINRLTLGINNIDTTNTFNVQFELYTTGSTTYYAGFRTQSPLPNIILNITFNCPTKVA